MALTKPFAENGDKKAIPQTTSDGSVSFNNGFGSLYALPPEEGGLFIDRAQFNQLMFDTTSQVLENKQQITAQANRINEVNTTLTQSINTKANQATTYTKTEVNNLVNAKANANATLNITRNQNVDGNTNFRGQLSRQTDPGASDNSAQVPTTRWINTFFNNKKAQITSFAAPDYTSTISGVGNNYRAPRDGYFVFSMTYGDGTKDITINGVVFSNVIPSSGGYGSGGLFVPLAKNDVINIGSNAVLSYSYFIPCKGAN